jgi:TIR domain
MSDKRESQYEYDVFLNYSQEDEKLVDQLASRLMAQQLKVWYEPYSVLPGDQIPLKIADGLLKSRVVLAVLSPSSVKSWWANKEWSVRFMQISREGTCKVIPLLLKACVRPPFFSDTKYIDFQNVDFDNPLIFETKLQELINYIKESLPGPNVTSITLPMVIIAMNRIEAEELVSGEVFEGQLQLKKRFDDFIEMLKPFRPNSFSSQYPESFLNQYKDFREDWQPFFDDNKTIGQIIDGMVDWVNRHHPDMKTAFVERQYYSDKFLALNIDPSPNDDPLKTWEYLRNVGCLLVLDIISLFHPKLGKLFRDSYIGVSTNVSIVGISPFNTRAIQANQELEKILREQFSVIFNRFDSYAPECTFEIGDGRSLSRWLYSVLPQTSNVIQKLKADPENVKKIQSLVTPRPHGGSVFPLILGGPR